MKMLVNVSSAALLPAADVIPFAIAGTVIDGEKETPFETVAAFDPDDVPETMEDFSAIVSRFADGFNSVAGFMAWCNETRKEGF